MFISTTPSAFIISVCMVPTNKLRNIMKYMSFVENVSVPNSVKKLTAHCTCKEIKKTVFFSIRCSLQKSQVFCL